METPKLDNTNKSEHVYFKSRKSIAIDNLIGGIVWGIGSIVGATLVIAIVGIIMVRSENIPFLGDIVKIFVNEVQLGINEFNNKLTD